MFASRTLCLDLEINGKSKRTLIIEAEKCTTESSSWLWRREDATYNVVSCGVDGLVTPSVAPVCQILTNSETWEEAGGSLMNYIVRNIGNLILASVLGYMTWVP